MAFIYHFLMQHKDEKKNKKICDINTEEHDKLRLTIAFDISFSLECQMLQFLQDAEEYSNIIYVKPSSQLDRAEKTRCVGLGLREEAEGVENGSVKWVTQVGSPVVKWAFSSSSSLDSKAQEGNHSKTSMLDLSKLKCGFFLRVSSKAQWVEE